VSRKKVGNLLKITFQRLIRTLANLLHEEFSLSEINQFGQAFLQGLLDKESSPDHTETIHKEDNKIVLCKFNYI